MLLKWLFTILAVLWLYEAVTRIRRDQRLRQQRPPAPRRRDPNEDAEFSDYEELK